MKTNIILLSLLVCITSASTFAAQLKLAVYENKLNIVINNVKYPDFMNKELKNGLPNTLSVNVEVIDTQGRGVVKEHNYTITYDLWDEHYLLSFEQNQNNQTRLFKSDSALFSWLNAIPLQALELDNSVSLEEAYTVRVQAFFNPIEKERINKIKKWMKTSKGFDAEDEVTLATHNVKPTLPSSNVFGSPQNTEGQSLRSSGPRFQKLFDKILEEQVNEHTRSAQWKSQPISQSFSFRALINANLNH